MRTGTTGMRIRAGAAAVAAVAVALSLAGCGADRGEHGTQPAGATESATVENRVQVLTVAAGNDLKFEQTALFAHVGKVKIVFTVTGDIPHNLAFKDGSEGSTGTVSNSATSLTVLFTKPGTYNFLCTIHPYMKGTLTIS